ncbi:NEL-type E3 ubiquitin ligase domain-containing protein [Pseudomonas maumuensis]|uniref:NEL domain-containing protein n=1 Tax=Pseudomonas maumuensis TaxID=2842354 RepID=A0ABX8NGF6_9PSED|nr:NEL-type E3 ubiquitin ligase domain-containing protein [Pseudomonas maumuensis]QXH55079.1 hypothetical protein KSS90_17225 [Pseudomonas maumuensis]
MSAFTLTPKVEHATDQFIGELLPTWLKTAPAAEIAQLREAYSAYKASQHKVAAVFGRLLPVDAFAQGLLQTELTRRTGLTVDLARACWREERRTFTVKPGQLPKSDSYFVSAPALQKLMQNFKQGESFYSGTALVYPANAATGAEERLLTTASQQLVQLTRDVDAGKQYQERLDQLFSKDFVDDLGEDMRLASAFMAEIAATRRLMPPRELQVLRDLAAGRSVVYPQCPNIQRGELQVLGCVLSGMLVVELAGTWLPGLSGTVKRRRISGVLLYMPDDPSNPVRFLATWEAVNTTLLEWLNVPQKRALLLQRVALQDRAEFLQTLGQRLQDDEPDLAPEVDALVGDLFTKLAERRIRRIRDDARFLLVPNTQVDQRQSSERLALMASVGLAMLNLAGLFVPGLGSLLLANMVRETVSQVCEGVADWAQGHQHEAFEHLLGVAESVAVNATVMAGAKVVTTVFTRSVWVDGLEPVVNDAGEHRLWRNDLTPYQDASPPAQLSELDNGLLSDGKGLWWRHQGVHYRVRATSANGPWRLLDGRRPQGYGPALEFNGERAWRMTHERPLEWQGSGQLLGRLWPPAEDFSIQRVTQVLKVAGVDEAYLRGLLVEGRRLPLVLRDTLERFAVDTRVDAFLANPDSDTELWQWCLKELGVQDLELPAQRDTLSLQAESLRGRLFEYFSEAYLLDDPQLALLNRDFPSLPKAYAVHLLTRISVEQRTAMRTGSRIPLALAQQARELLQVAKLTRLCEGFYLRASYRPDLVKLAFALLGQEVRWPASVALELRDGSPTGRVLASLGAPSAPGQAKVLVNSNGVFSVYEGDGSQVLVAEPAGLPEALLACLDQKDRMWFGWGEADAARQLRRDLQNWLPSDREALLQLLGMRDIGSSHNPPQRLADGRVGYLLSGRMSGDHASHTLLMARIRSLYPGFNQLETRVFLDILLARPGSAFRNLLQQEQQYQLLKRVLALWVGRARGSDAMALRRRAGRQLRRCWQLIGERIVDQWDVPLGMSLSLNNTVLRSLPHLPASIDFGHVAELTLTGLSLEQIPDGFLRCFAQLRWLNLGNNALASVPVDIGHLSQLRNLRMAENRIIMGMNGAQALGRLTRLQSLDLSFNPLGAISLHLRPLTRLRELNLRSTNLLTVPADLQWCGQLEIADLRDNHLASMPQAVLDAPQAWRRALLLTGNPLPEAIRQRLGIASAIAVQGADGPSALAAVRAAWLEGEAAPQLQSRGDIWDTLHAEAGSGNFFQLLAELSATRDFQQVPVDLRRRVWAMLEAAAEDTALRDELFTLAGNARTCADSVASCFSSLEVRLYMAQTLREANPLTARAARLRLARRLFRLDQVEAIAREDIRTRISLGQHVDEIEVSLAYRTGLASRLDLPGQPRTMHFETIAGVAQSDLDAALAAVRQAEAGEALPRYISQRDFWIEGLRSWHGERFSEVEAPFWARLEALDNLRLDSSQYLILSNQLAVERQDAVEALVLCLTQEALIEVSSPGD